jgi:hypothetical protein
VTRCRMDLAPIDEGGVTGSWETGAGIKNVRHVHMHGGATDGGGRNPRMHAGLVLFSVSLACFFLKLLPPFQYISIPSILV